MDDKKTCSQCGERKPIGEFNRKKTAPDGRRAECRECTREYRKRNAEQIQDYNAAYYQANRDALKETGKLYYLEHRDKISKQVAEYRAQRLDSWKEYYAEWRKNNPDNQRWSWIKYKYGITKEQYGELFDAQAGLCAICRDGCPAYKVLSVDHCHETGTVRGLLCDRCNKGLGQFRDEPQLLMQAAKYLNSARAAEYLAS